MKNEVKVEDGEILDTSTEWKILYLQDITENLDNKRIPINEEERQRRPGNIPYYGASGQTGWIDDYLFDEPLLLIAEDGENLVSRVLPIAYCIEGKTWVNNHAHVLRVTKANMRYLMYYMNTIDVSPYLTGTTRPKLNKSQLMIIKVLVPPPSEQMKIVSVLSSVDDHLQKTEEIMEQIQRLKKGLMQELLTGKIRIKA